MGKRNEPKLASETEQQKLKVTPNSLKFRIEYVQNLLEQKAAVP